MNKFLLACALLCASSGALAGDNSYVCGAGTELSVSFPENQDDSKITVNGIEYDYANSYAVRRDPNNVMYEFSHNMYSVFMVVDPVNKEVSINYEGRNEVCVRGTPYDL